MPKDLLKPRSGASDLSISMYWIVLTQPYSQHAYIGSSLSL